MAMDDETTRWTGAIYSLPKQPKRTLMIQTERLGYGGRGISSAAHFGEVSTANRSSPTPPKMGEQACHPPIDSA